MKLIDLISKHPVPVTRFQRPYVIAEAGVNHEGSMDIARRLIDEAALVLGEPQVTTDVVPVVEALAAAAVEGLRPDGSLIYEYDPQTERIDADRHWWVQAEAVVGFFNMYERTGDEAFLRRSHDAWQYIRTHLLDGGNGEWFWSVRADGSVNRDDDKAGFWKCPYHNSRMCMELIRRIERLLTKN